MTLIKCPNCGRTVLSVASVCPGCSVPLTRDRPPHTWGGTLTECRRCGHPVTTEASVCPHCSVRRPGRPAVPVALLAAFTVVLASTVTLGVIMPRLTVADRIPRASAIRAGEPAVTPVDSPRDTSRPSQSDTLPAVALVTDTTPAPSPPPRDSQPRDTVRNQPRDTTLRADAPPPVVAAAAAAPPESRPAEPVKPPPEPARPDPIPEPSDPARTPLTRWVGTQWVNVRAGPGDESAVVAQLRPGQRVEAGAPTPDGWQMVYVDGRRVGYVARSLLTSVQPR